MSSSRGRQWQMFAVLQLGALAGAIGVLPYSLALAPPTLPPSAPPLAVLLLASVVQTLVLTGLAAIGLWLGERIGLGAPLLRAWLAGDPAAPRRSPIFWVTPGGSLKPGETHEEAARRELWEETGIDNVPLGPWVWTHDHVLERQGEMIRLHERFFVVRLASTSINLDNM